MNKMTRMLVMTGMAFAVSATIGAGAASASPAEPAATSAAKAASQSADIRLQPGRTRVIGYFRSPLACHKVGRIGEFRDRWDDYSCVRVRGGFHRGSWALVARWDRHGWPGHGGGHGRRGLAGRGTATARAGRATAMVRATAPVRAPGTANRRPHG